MLDFDESIKAICNTNTIYKRYVDDILILRTSLIDASFVEKFKKELNAPLDFFRGFFDMIVAGRRDYALMTEAHLVKPV